MVLRPTQTLAVPASQPTKLPSVKWLANIDKNGNCELFTGIKSTQIVLDFLTYMSHWVLFKVCSPSGLQLFQQHISHPREKHPEIGALRIDGADLKMRIWVVMFDRHMYPEARQTLRETIFGPYHCSPPPHMGNNEEVHGEHARPQAHGTAVDAPVLYARIPDNFLELSQIKTYLTITFDAPRADFSSIRRITTRARRAYTSHRIKVTSGRHAWYYNGNQHQVRLFH